MGAYGSEGVQIFNNSFNIVHSDKQLCRRLARHASSKTHIFACDQLVKKHDQYSKLGNKPEIEVKVENPDFDDEPLNKIRKLSDDVIDISCKEEIS